MARVQELLREAADLPGDSARRDAEILLGHCLQKSRSWLYAWPEADVAEQVVERYREMLAQRRQGMPVAYLIGQREFWSLSLAVNEHTLIPRPETETLVEWALQLPLPAAAKVLDLGTGCGAIALALAQERPGWQLLAVDASPGALQIATGNGARLELGNARFLLSDWYADLDTDGFDLIVSNPPYVAPGDPHLVEGDLRFEPDSALVAADDGLADLRHIVAGACAHLGNGGFLLLEHGAGQGEAVRTLLLAAGFAAVETRSDLAGRERISGGQWHAG